MVPWETLHFMTKLVDTMDMKSREIYHNKKMALVDGDEEVINKIGMGKDITSILRKVSLLMTNK